MKKLGIFGLAAVAFLAVGCQSTGVKPEASFEVSQLAPEMSVERIRRGVREAKDLEFPTVTSDVSKVKRPAMAIFRPQGEGPFPALVLAHQCGGLNNPSTGWQNFSMLEWAKKAVDRGYVVLLIDQLTQRGVPTRCKGKSGGLNFARATKDVLQAADHLRGLEFVDRNRIGVVGYSFGAMLALLSSSERWGKTLAPTSRFSAAVSFYPGCFTIRPGRGEPYEIVNADLNRPTLVLLGGKDGDTPAWECIKRLEIAKRKGSLVEWHLYPDATHCWDCENLNGHSKVTHRGYRTTYYFDREVTQDSSRRMFAFLEKHLAKARTVRPVDPESQK